MIESIDLATKYQQKTDKQHILDNPDTYIGSIEMIDSDLYVMNEIDGRKVIKENTIQYIPGLFKLFDEGIVNCRDHAIRMEKSVSEKVENAIPVSSIDVSIDEISGMITMINDGNGIDIAQHPETNIWIPEMIFGHLRTSTNYDKTEKKIVGGKNGFGFKLVLIWSTYGEIETVDHIRGLKYKQEFRQNLDIICPPQITKCKNKPYTKITFHPDYQRFGITGLTQDMINLFHKRVYDIAAVTDKSLKVRYNLEPIPVKNFTQYIDLYIGSKEETLRAYESSNERWEYAVALSSSHEFCQVSFVNGIHTSKGGKHVEYILGQITRKLVEFIEKKKKIKVNMTSIKEQIILFLRCDIENPAFDSQTKDYMNTPSSKFGSSCQVSDKFIEKIAKMGIMDAACAITELKDTKAVKKMDGQKTKNVRGIPKLTDANWAGTERSSETMIIFCEGDSAKAGIISGLSSEDRNLIGVYPMKGKIMNVRGELQKKIADNKEIADIKKILGLELSREYNAIEDVHKYLRYSKVIFMCDADLDGNHIKGLGINLFQSEWPSLAKIPGFIGFMSTPILKARKGSKEMSFYNECEYEQWKTASGSDVLSWKIKYYKGLGTSTGKEFREYFKDKKTVEFEYGGKESDDAIDMVFNKKRSDDRKDWLRNYDRQLFVDTSQKTIRYEDFIHKELIHFSKYDCDRSIPNLMDGLKISLRKILYSAFKKGLTTEIKVAQFSGYVSEHSCYHHGEASLNGAIIGMAQNFVGSNNINLFMPNGQMGTRLMGGQDAASERYIFTQLSKITRYLFSEKDDPILSYLNDDGTQVEPVYYAPIIPMILVNGTKGIGTGFSTNILCYHPNDIIQYLKCKLIGDTYNGSFIPYYDGFKGEIIPVESKSEEYSSFLVKGCYEIIGTDKIKITELPVGTWTNSFKEYLEEMLDMTDSKTGKKIPSIIKDYDDMSKDTSVEFIITLQKGKLSELLSTKTNLGIECDGVHKAFKLITSLTTSNMHLFDANEKLKKYQCVPEIIDDYYVRRLELYIIRKKHMIDVLSSELLLLSNKSKYIQEILDGTIDLRKKKREEVIKMLSEKQYYDKIDTSSDTEYKYLTRMPMDSVTEENVAKLKKEYNKKNKELGLVQKMAPENMWLEELIKLEEEYLAFKEEKERFQSDTLSTNEKQTKKKVKKMPKMLED
jgi:DNA topoisomerase-2